MKPVFDKNTKVTIGDSVYTINSVYGVGASSIVYLAEEQNLRSLFLIKEYNPDDIKLSKDTNGNIIVSKDDIQKYSSGLVRFIQGGERQNEIRNQIHSLMNSTSLVSGIYKAYNTAYIIMPIFNGATYDNYFDESISELLKHIRALTVVVNEYHKNGFLHLDIKPSNIFILKDITDLVMLFDFDSVIAQKNLDYINCLSYSHNWAAPEVRNYRYRDKIAVQADIFSIGELLFYKILGRHSFIREQRRYSKYDYSNAHLLLGFGNDLKNIITDILRHTITTLPSNRYVSCDDLIIALDKAIELANPRHYFWMDEKILVKDFFIGRDLELEAIKEALSSNNVVIVRGFGGIGKTELVRQYAVNNEWKYRNIIFIAGNCSLKSIIYQKLASKIVNYSFSEESECDDKSVIDLLYRVVSKDDLIIIDNVEENFFSEEESELRGKLLGLGCKFLLTSRYSSDSYKEIEVDKLSYDDLMGLVSKWYGQNIVPNEYGIVQEIINIVDGHTLSVELIAKQARAKFITLEEQLNLLKKEGLGNQSVKILSSKDFSNSRRTIIDHISSLFNLSDLSNEEKALLTGCRLIPLNGIDGCLVNKIFNPDNTVDLAHLIDSGWLTRRGNIITLHPIINTVLIEQHYTCDYDAIMKRFEDIIKVKAWDTQLNELYVSIITNLRGKYISLEFLNFLSVENVSPYRTSKRLHNMIDEVVRIKDDCLNLDAHYSVEILSDITTTVASEDFPSEANSLIEITEAAIKEYNIDDKVIIGNLVHAKGAVAYFAADFKGALEYFKQESVLMVDDPFELANSYSNMADVEFRLDNNEEACRLYIAAFKIFQKIEAYGDESLQMLDKLCEVYTYTHQYKKAEICIKKAYDISFEKYGSESRLTQTFHATLANFYSATKQYDTAIDILLKEKQLAKDSFGEISRGMANICADLADAYGKKGDFKNACKMIEESNNIFNKISIVSFELIMKNYLNISRSFLEQEDLESANRYIDKAIEIAKSRSGEINEADIHVKVLIQKGRILQLLNDTDANNYYCKAKEIVNAYIPFGLHYIEDIDSLTST